MMSIKEIRTLYHFKLILDLSISYTLTFIFKLSYTKPKNLPKEEVFESAVFLNNHSTF